MDKENRPQRLEKAISYLVNNKMIDGKDIIKEISEKVDRHPNNVRSALRGEERYLTYKFIKSFCMIFGGIISPDWIWDGSGEMLNNSNYDTIKENRISEETLSRLTREELIGLVKQLMALHSEQTAMYQMLIRQNDQMIRNGQERFNNITSIIFKNV